MEKRKYTYEIKIFEEPDGTRYAQVFYEEADTLAATLDEFRSQEKLKALFDDVLANMEKDKE